VACPPIAAAGYRPIRLFCKGRAGKPLRSAGAAEGAGVPAYPVPGAAARIPGRLSLARRPPHRDSHRARVI